MVESLLTIGHPSWKLESSLPVDPRHSSSPQSRASTQSLFSNLPPCPLPVPRVPVNALPLPLHKLLAKLLHVCVERDSFLGCIECGHPHLEVLAELVPKVVHEAHPKTGLGEIRN